MTWYNEVQDSQKPWELYDNSYTRFCKLIEDLKGETDNL